LRTDAISRFRAEQLLQTVEQQVKDQQLSHLSPNS
jgi:hypothetical protein